MSAYVVISYLHKEGAKFDIDYYINTHMRIVDKHWRPLGMKSWRIIQYEEGDPSGVNVQAITEWTSLVAFDNAIKANIPEVMQDLQHYSNEAPVRYYAKELARG